MNFHLRLSSLPWHSSSWKIYEMYFWIPFLIYSQIFNRYKRQWNEKQISDRYVCGILKLYCLYLRLSKAGLLFVLFFFFLVFFVFSFESFIQLWSNCDLIGPTFFFFQIWNQNNFTWSYRHVPRKLYTLSSVFSNSLFRQ